VQDRIDLIASAKIALRSPHGRSQFSKQRPGSLAGWKGIADFQIRTREIEGESSREQFWKRSNYRAVANLQGSPALRELHWHPNTDEWQYVIEGDVSVTMFGSHGRFRTELLHTGDAGYIPQGYGHSIENVRSTASRILIAFNSGFMNRSIFPPGLPAIQWTFSPQILTNLNH
jgi:mannose-6-phosphate isomerase-like protein (cupin superfamily)